MYTSDSSTTAGILAQYLAAQQQKQQDNANAQLATSLMNTPTPQGQIIGGGGNGTAPGGGQRMPGSYVGPSGGAMAAAALQKAVGGYMLGKQMNDKKISQDQASVADFTQPGGQFSQMQEPMQQGLMTAPNAQGDALGGQIESNLGNMGPADGSQSATAAESALNNIPPPVSSVNPATAGMGGLGAMGSDELMDDVGDF